MFRRPFPFHLFAASLLTTVLASAQTPAVTPQDKTNPGSTEQKHLSAHIATALREKLPTFTAVPAKTPESSPSPETAPDTVVLEKRVILGTKSLSFTPLELANPAGLAALLRKRYPGASVPADSRLPNYAALMLADDERLTHIAELESVVENLRLAGDTKASKELKKEISRAFIRGHDWRNESLDRSANNNRR